MKFKGLVLASLLTVSSLSAMHADLVGQNPASINRLYHAAKAAALPATDVALLAHVKGKGGNTTALVDANWKAAHHPAANSPEDALLQSMHAGTYAPYVANKVATIKKVLGAIIDYLGDAGGANSHVVLGNDAATFKGMFLPAYDALLANPGVGALATPVNHKLSDLSGSLGALQVNFDGALDPIAQALSANANDPIVDAAAMARVAGMAAALAADPDLEIQAAAAAFPVLINDERDTFVAAVKAAIDAVL